MPCQTSFSRPVSVSQSFRVVSPPPPNSVLPSRLKASACTSRPFGVNASRSSPVTGSHSLTRPSMPPLASALPSALKARAPIMLCAFASARTFPVAVFHRRSTPS